MDIKVKDKKFGTKLYDKRVDFSFNVISHYPINKWNNWILETKDGLDYRLQNEQVYIEKYKDS